MKPEGVARLPPYPPLPAPSNFPFQEVGNHTSSLMTESLVGFDTPTTRQNAGTSTAVVVLGGVNDPAGTAVADVSMVLSGKPASPARLSQDRTGDDVLLVAAPFAPSLPCVTLPELEGLAPLAPSLPCVTLPPHATSRRREQAALGSSPASDLKRCLALSSHRRLSLIVLRPRSVYFSSVMYVAM